MKGLIGKKMGMTSIFNDEGNSIAVTIIKAGPNYVSQVKAKETDGYDATQLAFDEAKERNTTKAQMGHFNKCGINPQYKLKEIRTSNGSLKQGQELSVNLFEEGDIVNVVGTSKGKGFQGVVKRYGFSGVGMSTHGQHNRLRAPGSIGASSTPSRVFKGMRMAGRMGGNRVKIKNLRVEKIDTERNLIFVNGAVPGAKGSYVLIQG